MPQCIHSFHEYKLNTWNQLQTCEFLNLWLKKQWKRSLSLWKWKDYKKSLLFPPVLKLKLLSHIWLLHIKCLVVEYLQQIYIYIYISTHKRMRLTSPSVDSSCRSLRPLTFSDPSAALTSTPLGASMVRVRVGDSSLAIKKKKKKQQQLSDAADELIDLFCLYFQHVCIIKTLPFSMI